MKYLARVPKTNGLVPLLKGSIIGVALRPGPNCCEQIKELAEGKIYHPDEAPYLPLPDCPRGSNCECVYRPVMTYQEREPQVKG